MAIITVSIPSKLFDELDASVEKRGFASRSEVLRQAVRAFLEESRSFDDVEGEVIATVTVIYEKASKSNRMLSIQHEHGGLISTFLHTHVDKDSCLEVMVVRGPAQAVRKLVDAMNADRQVRQVKVSVVGAPVQ